MIARHANAFALAWERVEQAEAAAALAVLELNRIMGRDQCEQDA